MRSKIIIAIAIIMYVISAASIIGALFVLRYVLIRTL